MHMCMSNIFDDKEIELIDRIHQILNLFNYHEGCNFTQNVFKNLYIPEKTKSIFPSVSCFT